MANDLFPEPSESSKVMNALIVGQAERGKSYGTLFRSGGEPTPTNEAMRERLSGALDRLEAAQRSGDDDAIYVAETALDQMIAESRQSRDHQGRDEAGRFTGEPAPSFDGGVQGRPSVSGLRGIQQESANSLFRRMLETSRAEAAENGQERSLVAHNI